MITRLDILKFFDQEAIAARERWEETMKLEVKDRIRKRRAIKDLYLDRNYHKISDDDNNLIRVTVSVNLSDFKEGQYLVLHREGTTSGIKCWINSFEGDEAIILEVYALPSLTSYYDVPLILDKDLVDLREFVFDPFISELPGYNDVFWKKLILNTKSAPSFDDKKKYEDEVDDTAKTYNFNLLPNQREAVINSLAAKDYYLVQGPPGTGKSYVLGLIILEEAFYFKHKVIVIGPNHMAINNTLGQTLKLLPQCSNNIFKVGQSYNAPTIKVQIEDKEFGIENCIRCNTYVCNSFEYGWVCGLTPHSLYTSRARGLQCDTLIIDEAGQMTIPLALMGMIKAKKVILAGDHKQLPPIISSEKVRDEMKLSAFQALMTEGNYTMLDVSFRMCEPICDFVSELFYDGKVKAMKKGCGDLIVSEEPLYDFHTPIVIHQVDDDGEQTSDKEATFIADTIAAFLKKGLPANEIAVLSPFRAQAANVRRHIRKQKDISEDQRKLITSDTIDRMQGQEREVIIYSLVSGNFDYMTEMAEFLYNPNKMNVAFSRAKSKLIIVGNIEKIKNISSIEYPHMKKMLESEMAHFV